MDQVASLLEGSAVCSRLHEHARRLVEVPTRRISAHLGASRRVSAHLHGCGCGQVLATACDLLLAEFATSLEQDLWLLQQPAGGGVDPWVAARRQQALHARVSRKRCLD